MYVKVQLDIVSGAPNLMFLEIVMDSIFAVSVVPYCAISTPVLQCIFISLSDLL